MEDSSDLRILKNKRRIFDVESLVHFNQAQVIVAESVIEEIRTLALKSFSSDAQSNRALLINTMEDILRNREMVIELLKPATPDEERFKSSMLNKVKIEELRRETEFDEDMMAINKMMVDINKTLIEIDRRIHKSNENLLEYLDELSSTNARWCDGELEQAMKISTSVENTNRVNNNTADSHDLLERATSDKEMITHLYERTLENRRTILMESESSGAIREDIVNLREKVSANQVRVAKSIVDDNTH